MTTGSAVDGVQPEALTIDSATASVAVIDAVAAVLLGKRQVLERVLAALISGGHVLLEDKPGLGKTLLAKSLARALGLDFGRVQFTPDLMPADVVGSSVPTPDAGLVFRHGPLFTELLLADEINRTPPKTQAALLEAMQEGQITVEGQTYRLPSTFRVIATSNPIDFEGTFPLPEAQLDRFLARISMGYPDAATEASIARNHRAGVRQELSVPRVLTRETFSALTEQASAVHVDPVVADYAVALARATRTSPRLAAGASPRGSIALVQMARGLAVLRSRSYLLPDDIQEVALDVLPHRLVLRPEAFLSGLSTTDVVSDALAGVEVPRVRSSG